MTTESKVLELFRREPQPSLSEIAEQVGLSRERVRQILKRHGLKSERSAGRPRLVVAEPPTPYISVDPDELTASDLRRAAMACRSVAHLKRHDAEVQKGSTVASIAAADAEAFEQLAAKFVGMIRAEAPAPRAENVVRLRPGSDHACDRNGPSAAVTMDAPTCSVCGVPQVFD